MLLRTINWQLSVLTVEEMRVVVDGRVWQSGSQPHTTLNSLHSYTTVSKPRPTASCQSWHVMVVSNKGQAAPCPLTQPDLHAGVFLTKDSELRIS